MRDPTATRKERSVSELPAPPLAPPKLPLALSSWSALHRRTDSRITVRYDEAI